MNLNIIIFSNLDISNGGVETWLHLFLNEVNDKKKYFDNVNIHFYHTPAHPVQLANVDHNNTVHFYPIDLLREKGNLFSNFLTLIKFHYLAIKRVKSLKESVVVSIGSYPSGIFDWIVLRLLCYRKKVKHFIWLRTTLSKHIKTQKSKIFSSIIFFLEKMALKDADIVIANGWDTKANYIKEYDIDSAVVPNAIAFEKYAGIPTISSLKKDKVRIAFIGRFYDSKGIFNFTNAIKIFNDKYDGLSHKVEFVFVGWGEPAVESFAGATANCELIGRVPNDKMSELLRNIHCGVALTKSNETDSGGSGVSNNLLELMAAGKIIIAYDNIIYRQFPRNDFLLYVKENNDEMLAESFADIVRSIESYLPLAINAKIYASEFSIKNHVKDLLDVITKAI